MTTNPAARSDSVSDLLTTTKATISNLTGQLAALPDENDEAIPNVRDRIVQQRQNLLAKWHHLTNLLRTVVELPPISPLVEWRNVLLTAVAEFEAELASLEDERASRPRDSVDQATLRRAEKREVGVRHALRILQTGPEHFPSGEFLPDALAEWFMVHGVTPVGGRWFNSRGGLKTATARIEQADRKRTVAVDELQFYLQQ